MMPVLPYSTMSVCAEECGLGVYAVLDVAAAQSALLSQRERLSVWQDAGYAGEMQYMLRSPAMLSDIKQLLPESRSVVCFVISYNWDSNTSKGLQGLDFSHVPPPGYGRVARYAWGRDYHRVLRKRLRRFVRRVEEELGVSGVILWRGFSDAVPLLERALVQEAGLGFLGKNTLLIRPGVGSFTFLAEVVWNVGITLDAWSGSHTAKSTACGSCTRCLSSCPTGALVSPQVLDARRCISYLTIEKRTDFDSWERKAVGDWVFGCDACQDVCPFNHEGAEKVDFANFSTPRASGPFLELIRLLSLRTDEEFTRSFAGTPLMRAGREPLLRNACCVIANTGFLPAVPSLTAALSEDSSQMVQTHAMHALGELRGIADGTEKRRIDASLRLRAVEEPESPLQ